MYINDFKVFARFSEISSLFPYFSIYFGMIFTSNKASYFSQISLFFVCSLFEIYHQSERNLWFYLAQDILIFISKIFEFLFKILGVIP